MMYLVMIVHALVVNSFHSVKEIYSDGGTLAALSMELDVSY